MTPLSALILIQPSRASSLNFVNRLRDGAQGGARDGAPAAPKDLIGLSSSKERNELEMVFSYDGWRKDAKRAEETHREFYPGLVPGILDKMRRKQQVHSGDRSHKYIRKLDALTPTLSYNGWKDDARKVEWPGTGDWSDTTAEKMFEVMRTKQAEHSGDRSHANLRELDQLKAALDYEGWSQDAERAEKLHRRGYSSLVPEILDKMRHKQQVHSGDRSHANLRELDELVAHLARNMQAPAPSAPQGSTSAVLWDADTLPTQRLIGAVLAGKSCALSCLGLQPHLTHPRKTIRARFRVLAIRLHPDKETHPQATAAFVKVRAAHDRLMASE